MADRKQTIPAEGETRFGGERPSIQGTFYIPSNGGALKGSVLAMDGIDTNGACTTWYFFVTAAGVMRVSSTYPTDTETDGSAV